MSAPAAEGRRVPGQQASGGPSGWRDRLHGARVRMIADPAFQRLVSGIPLLRWIARRKGRALFDLCAGFVYSQVLAAFVRLRLPERLRFGPVPLDRLAADLGLDRDPADRLLRASCALGLAVDRGAAGFALGDLGAALLGNPGVAAMIEHHGALYADLRDPVALLRGAPASDALARYWPYADGPAAVDGAAAGPYSRLMESSLGAIAEDVLDAYPVSGHRRLLDVGGGTGGFAIAAAARAPGLEVRSVDLPAVAGLARQRFLDGGLGARAEAVGLDFHRSPLPEGADLASLVRVCLDHPDERVRRLLRNIRRALPPGGRLLVAEAMVHESRPDPVGDAYFGFYLLAMGGGRCRSAEALTAMLIQAGFQNVRELATRRPMLARLLVAEA